MEITESLFSNTHSRFIEDIVEKENTLSDLVSESRFLVIGGAGSIGQSVTKELFRRNPKVLHVVDINENNLVELVRDIRSSLGYIKGDFRTLVLDCGSSEFRSAVDHFGPYDYVLNLSALKHVRSEKDPFTLMRMIKVNILNTIDTIELARGMNATKYFSVSSDKATNPVNMMGASKRIMEMFLIKESRSIDISSARFANVAFSDGSLLDGFNQRLLKEQPISVPTNINRYFINLKEAGELCLLSCLLGQTRDILFPKVDETLQLTSFTSIAETFLEKKGYEPYLCSSEEEARQLSSNLIHQKKWPCFFFESDTTGEKEYEEFFTEDSKIDLSYFKKIGIIKHELDVSDKSLKTFLKSIDNLLNQGHWERIDLVNLFKELVPNFLHVEKDKFLDDKM
jgi:FlaA1/EpsC-like NDP-sugar epimerase